MQVWDLHLRSRLTTNPEKFQLTIRTMGVRRMMVWILLQAFRPDHQPGRGVSNSQEQISSRKPISQTTSTEPNTAILADASCQTWDQSAVDIELQEGSSRRMSRCTSLRKKILYSKVYVKKQNCRKIKSYSVRWKRLRKWWSQASKNWAAITTNR